MIRTIDASSYDFHTPDASKAGEKRSLLLDIQELGEGLSFEGRSRGFLELSAVDKNGNTVFLDSGQVVKFDGKLMGFVALELVASEPVSYRCNKQLKWYEVPDPKRVTIVVDESTEKPIADLIEEALRKYVGKHAAENLLADEVSVQELIDDIYEGDHEFEDEPDPFGLGSVEMEAADGDDSDEPELPLGSPSAPAEPPAGSQPAPSSVPPGAPAPDGSKTHTLT